MRRIGISSRVLLACACLSTSGLAAATITKSATETDLTLASAWDLGAPTSADVATWSSTSLGGALTLGTSSAWLGINVAGATSDISISGAGTLTLGSSGITLGTSGVNLSVANAVTLGASQSWTVGANRTLTVSGAVGGTGNLGKYGDGTLVLSGTNSYSGGTEIYGGVLSVGSVASLGSGYLGIKNNATLRYTGTGSETFSRTLFIDLTNATVEVEQAAASLTIFRTGGTFSKQLTKTGAGTLRFGANTDNAGSSAIVSAGVLEGVSSAANNFANVTVNSGGTFRIGTTDGAGSAIVADRQVWNGGTLTVNSGGVFDLNGVNETVATLRLNGTGIGGAGALVNNNGSTTATPTATTFDLASTSAIGGSANISVASAISGVGGLVKRGAGTLTLSNANSYGGGTTLSQGTLVVTNASGLGSSGTVTIGDASTGSSATSILLGSVTMGRAITVSSNGNGTVTLGASGTPANPEFSGAITLQRDVTLSGGSNTDRMTFSGGISGTGNVTITGPNRVVMISNANTFTGNVTVNSGATLQLDYGTSTTRSYIPDASVVTVNGTLNFAKGSNSETIGGLSGSGTVQGHPSVGSTASTLVINNSANHTFTGALSNGGASGSTFALVKNGAGTQTLNGASSYTGGTTVNAGTLVIGHQNALGGYITGRPVSQVVVNAGGTVDFNGKWDATYGYTIAGTGATGAGALVNYGAGISTGAAQASNIKLAADASIGGTGNWALLTSGYNATTLDLAGYTLTKVGSNTVSLVNTTATAGAIRVSAGSLNVAERTANLSAVALTLDNVAGVSFGTGNFALTLASLAGGGATGGNVSLGTGSLTVGSSGASTTFAGALSGAGSLTKQGNGTLTLSGNSTYSLGTTLSAGAIAVGSNTALGTGAVTVASAGGIRAADGNARSLANNLTLSANTTLGDATANGALTFGGTVALGAARTLTTASDVTFSGVVSGGSLTKLGNGRLTLGGVAHAFNGDLTVSAGSLGLASGASLATPKIVMGDGTSLVAASGFTLGSGKQLQLGASGVATVAATGAFALGGGTLSLDIDPLAPDLLAVDGNLDLSSGTLAFAPVGGSYSSGTYTFLTYTGALTGSAAALTTTGLVDGSATSRLNFSLDDSVAGSVSLVVEGANASLLWTGATGGTWDSGSAGSANWASVGEVNYTGETDRFYDLDSVAFDDTGANRAISVGSALTVGGLGFSNATTDYALSGAGSLGGIAAITKSGAGAVDLDVAYTGTGGVSVSAGTLRLLDAGFAPGLGATVSVSGGRLEVGSGVTLGSAPVALTGGTLSVLDSAALGSGSVTLDGGTLELAATGTYSKAFTLGASGATLAAVAAGETTYSAALALDNALTLRSSAGSVLLVSGALTGSAALTKSGAGSANLGSASGFTGAINVSEGLLVVESALGTSGSHASAISIGGILSFTSSGSQTLSGAITGTGDLVKVAGGGTLTLSSANTGFSGDVYVTDATLSLGHSQAAGTGVVTLDNATLSRNVANTTVANNLVLGANGATLFGRQTVDDYTTFSGSITGSADLRVDGLVSLTGSASAFSGRYVIADGSSYLRFTHFATGAVSAANLLQIDTGAVRMDGISAATGDAVYTVGGLASGATAGILFGTSDTSGGGHNLLLDLAVGAGVSRTFGGTLTKNFTNNFRLRKSGDGTQVLNRGAGNGETLAGVSVTGGVLELAGSAVAFNVGYFTGSQSFSASNGGTLRVSQAWNLASGNSVSLDGGTLDVTSQANYLNTLSLAGGSTVSGAFRVGNSGNATITSTGDLAHTFSAALTLVNVGGRTLTFNVADGAQADDLVVSAGMVDYVSETESLTGTVVSKTGAGTLVLGGANTFSGNLSVGAGALRVTGTLGGGSYAGNIAVSGALAFQSDSNQTLSGLISGSGALAKSGAGSLTIGGANSGFSGNVLLLDGTILLGHVSALGTGTVTLAGGTLDLSGLAIANTINFAGGSVINAAANAPAVTVTGAITAEQLNNLPGSEVTLGTGASVDVSQVNPGKTLVLTGAPTLSNLGSFAGTLAVAGSLDLSSAGNRPAQGATLELRAGGSLNFGSGSDFTGTVAYKGGAVQGSAFKGTLSVSDENVVLTNANVPVGKVAVGAGASVDVSAFTGTVRLTDSGAVSAGLSTFAGTLELGTGASLDLTDTPAPNADVTVVSGGTLAGSGSLGDVTLAAGGTLAPGNSPGIQNLATLTLNASSFLEFEILNTGGGIYPPTAGTDYDTIVVSGLLDISALSSANQVALTILSLADLTTAGDLQDFDPAATYAFDLISYGSVSSYEGPISQFFDLDTTGLTYAGFALDPAFLSLVDTGSSIQLQYAPIPEPSTYGLMLGGLALAGAALRRRRRKG